MQEPTPTKPHRARWIIPAVIASGMLGTIAFLLYRAPTYPAEGTTLNDPQWQAASDPVPLRVATFNIASGVGKDDVKDVSRTIAALKGFDIAGLEEVGEISWPDGGGHLLRQVAEAVQAPWVFSSSERRWGVESFGNGILCKLPITHWQRFPLSSKISGSNRSVLLVDAVYQGQPLHVLISHIDRGADHNGEVQTVLTLFRDLAPPALLLADLNTIAADPQLQAFNQRPDIVNALVVSHVSIDPSDVDWIFAKGLRCTGAGFSDNGASDHHLAWATMTLP